MVTALAMLGALTGLGFATEPAAAAPTPDAAEGRRAEATEGPCTTANGVTVIIDFQELEGGSYVLCAPNAPRTGFEALEQAGISSTPTTRSPGFLCRIAGIPSASGTPVKYPKKDDPATVADACVVPSPTTAYWSYWLAPRGGYWCYSNFGAGNRRPPAGTVEGWSFVLNRSASATPPPRIAPPAPIPGVAAAQLPGKDCTVPSEGEPPATTAPSSGPSSTRPPASPGSPSNPAGPSAPTRPGTGPGRPSGNGSLGGSSSGPNGSPISSTPPITGGDGKTSTTVPSDGSTSTTGSTGAATPSDSANGDGVDPASGIEGSGDRGITDPDEIAALEGDIDLSDDGRSKGSPVPLVAAGVVAAGLVAGGVRQRRRRQAGTDPS